MTFFVYLFDQFSELGQKSKPHSKTHRLTNGCIVCKGSYELNFIDSHNQSYKRTSNDYKNVYARFQLNSSECNIAINATVSVKNEIEPSELLGYTIATVVICALQLWTCIRMSKNIIQSEPEGVRVSLLSLGFFIGWDVFLCLFYLYNALTINVNHLNVVEVTINRLTSITSSHQPSYTLF